MKKVGISFLCTLFLVMGLTGLSYASKDLNFEKINQNMSAALEGVSLQFESFLTDFSYRINGERTDIEKDQYSFSLDAILKKTPWVDEPTEMALTLDMRVRPDGEPGIELGIQNIANTNPIAFSQYLANLVDCPVIEPLQGVQRVLMQVDCGQKANYEKVKSLDDLKAVFEGHFNAAVTALAEYEHGLTKDLGALGTPQLRDYVSRELKISQQVRESLANAKIQKTENGFEVKVGEIKCNELLWIKGIHINVTENMTSINAVLRTPLGETLYEASRADIIKLLKGLEQNKEYALEHVKMDSRVFFNYVEAILFPEQGGVKEEPTIEEPAEEEPVAEEPTDAGEETY